MNAAQLNYYESLFEQLLQCTADDFALMFFFEVDQRVSYLENKNDLQQCVEFIYRCLKCNLLKFNIGYQNVTFNNGYVITSLEEIAELIAKRQVNLSFAEVVSEELNSFIWLEDQVYATPLLDQIAEDCGLVAYEDDVDFNDPRGLKFKEMVEKVFSDNGLPWNLDKPLFPV